MNDIEKNELIPIDNKLSKIENLVYIIRGKQVMLDYDLATLYGYEVRALNQQVKRNIKRFPDDFMFQLIPEEVELVKSQFVISPKSNFFSGQDGGRRKLPYAFTEQGIYMLATVLKGEIAEKQSIFIMRAFREMRHFVANNSLLFDRISHLELKQLEYQKNTNEKFNEVFKYINENSEIKQKIFFNGQIYDAFSLIVSIIKKATKEIILIDNYVDIITLNILAKKNRCFNAIIYTHKGNNLSEIDIENFNAQYPKLFVKKTVLFHDRFIILDNSTTYHIGASIKDAGKKCFAISLLEDPNASKSIIDMISKID